MASPITRRLLFSLLALAAAGPAGAQLAEELTITGSARQPLALAPLSGAAGPAATELLRTDLQNSGVFTFSDGADAYRVQGSATGSEVVGALMNPAGQSVFQRTYALGDLRASVHALADDIVAAVSGTRGFSSSRIVFVARRGRAKEIFLCDYDGSNLRQLTRDGVIAVAPAISDDRRTVAFTSYRSGYPDIYTMDLRAGEQRRIISFPGTNGGPAFSPDGGRLALTMSFSGNSELYVTGSAGGRPRALTRSPSIESSPAWSPDGREIVYCANPGKLPQLYRISAGGGAPSRFSVGYDYCTEPDWSPDGRQLAFCARSGGSMVIAVHDLGSGRTRQLRAGEDPSWGADSRHLIYAADGALYRLDTLSGAAVRILPQMSGISEPSWSL